MFDPVGGSAATVSVWTVVLQVGLDDGTGVGALVGELDGFSLGDELG